MVETMHYTLLTHITSEIATIATSIISQYNCGVFSADDQPLTNQRKLLQNTDEIAANQAIYKQ